MEILKYEDGFLVGVVTEKAKEIFNSGMFQLYELFEGGESLIDTFDMLNSALERGSNICIELNFIDQIKNI